MTANNRSSTNCNPEFSSPPVLPVLQAFLAVSLKQTFLSVFPFPTRQECLVYGHRHKCLWHAVNMQIRKRRSLKGLTLRASLAPSAMHFHDTIAAISTAPGTGAIALLRLSGPEVGKIAAAVLGKPLGAPRVSVLRDLRDSNGEVVDQVLATHFPAPHSYTGEDVLELACHGGVLVTRRVLETLLAAGARSAGPGEFSQRAFLNGKMDLTQAEAVMDLISAQTNLALRAAQQQLEGRLGREIDRKSVV